MTVRSVPIFLQAGSHPAEETRLMLGGMLGTATGSFAGGIAASDPAHGVVRPNDFAVSQNGTPNMSVNVAAGGAFIRGTQSANQGAYHVWNDGTVNLSVTAADATNGRKDLVIAQVRDAYYSGATNDARITIVTGTAAASPADPSLAAFPNALVLARITVAAASTTVVTAGITDLRPIANITGALPTFATQALATTAIPSPVDGQGYYQNTNTSAEGPTYWNGSAWRKPWNMPWGLVASYGNIGSVTTGTHTTMQDGSVPLTLTTTTVTNRIYRVNMEHQHYASGGANAITRRLVIGGVTQRDYNMLNIAQFVLASCTNVSYYTETAGQSRIFKVQIAASGSNAAVNDNNFVLTVEDVGPAGAPA